MNRHQLATLLSWTGEKGFSGRKRLQKVVFLLQYVDCDLGCRYTLHHFGPYSRDVADACDEMVAANLIEETVGLHGDSVQYTYTLTPETLSLAIKDPEPLVDKFKDFGKQLISMDLWRLELGSTILFFYEKDANWDKALKKACEYKKVVVQDAKSQNALGFAKELQERHFY